MAEHPHLAFPAEHSSTVAVVQDYMKHRSATLDLVRESLHKAQERMKWYANKRRTDRNFLVGDWVYLKLQPYRQTSVALRKNLKLSAKFYGPFKIIAKVGAVAYKLELPAGSKIHRVSCISAET
ncbi:hypothetical protein FRX31_014193 [Thalictrum thalictroides]|uniref:Tf2-1-like SH3-like domain-containing protein n=1 Tax=Thalictrum thalictroides TaxID=46969 RepID=A0A7J6WFR1_THATH|nr:hypothetical protein FRX31_014193 [Thalictrum thalictroides]